MTRSNGYQGRTGEPRCGQDSADEEVRGRYVKGSCGEAGTDSVRRAGDVKGQGTGGDYGAVGSAGALAPSRMKVQRT